MRNYIANFKIQNFSNKDLLWIVISFFLGAMISIAPIILKFINNYMAERRIDLDNKIKLKKIKESCKDINSEYSKLLNLGFPKTAVKKFNNCVDNEFSKSQ